MSDDKLYLPEHFDGTTVSQVAAALLERRGKPVELSAERVKTAGALGLQILISANTQWNEDGQTFEVVSASDDLIQASEVLGMNHADLGLATKQVVG
ncbi:MAG: STAS domain-containing protein [Pseudomonadota bacterium]